MRTKKLINTTTVLLSVLGISAATPSLALGRGAHHHRKHHLRHSRRHGLSARAAAGSVAGLGHVGAGAVDSLYHPAGITGTTYYVSPTGSDANSGTSPNQAWRTVDRVNRAQLRPGDGVLFQGGGTYGDDALMPGWGTGVSGTSSQPVVFGTYGQGLAALPKGVWVKNETNLVFQNFNIGPVGAVSGYGDDITVQGCTIHDIVHPQTPSDTAEEAIDVVGSGWVIRDNNINRTGDSGMLLEGDHYTVTGNTIDNTGLDPAITWGDHGIYLKASDSTVTYNTIVGYHNDGVSVRYRNSTVSHNVISNGQIAIAYFQGDTQPGDSQWTYNEITGDTVAGIYVSPSGDGGNTMENFTITNNAISKAGSAASYWVAMNLHPTTGSYRVASNSVS